MFDAAFAFGHMLIGLPDEMKWRETRAWTLPELKAILAASQEQARQAAPAFVPARPPPGRNAGCRQIPFSRRFINCH